MSTPSILGQSALAGLESGLTLVAGQSLGAALNREKKRNLYTGAQCALAEIQCGPLLQAEGASRKFVDAITCLNRQLRVNDEIGWLAGGETLGVLFTDLSDQPRELIERALWEKIERAGLREYTTLRWQQAADFDTVDYIPSPILEPIQERTKKEQKRSERSGRGFVLALVSAAPIAEAEGSDELLVQFTSALGQELQPFDTVGWQEKGRRIAILFAEPELTNRDVASLGLAVSQAANECDLDVNSVSISYLPNDEGRHEPSPEELLATVTPAERHPLQFLVKRLVDVLGSAVGLLVLSPLFALLALTVKLSSPGPVFFRQTRVGFRGREFTFYKFRSMRHGNDPSEHEKFVATLISGAAPQCGTFKLKSDSRITGVGKFLRKTSLDELPQLYNVLRGDMSLIGPRPPIPYEVKRYSRWHRRRLYAAMPGITGLWQVEGRSRVTFDEMVRLDLRYGATWNLWQDVKILLKTPKAVLGGSGAR
ncbi:hypothetical protein F183_A54670 (plasmid) [Bryobacterales bacterium F-183]|nr:hypothetical protein F183_A54670 [Bryobacterales bacterium F-183]